MLRSDPRWPTWAKGGGCVGCATMCPSRPTCTTTSRSSTCLRVWSTHVGSVEKVISQETRTMFTCQPITSQLTKMNKVTMLPVKITKKVPKKKPHDNRILMAKNKKINYYKDSDNLIFARSNGWIELRGWCTHSVQDGQGRVVVRLHRLQLQGQCQHGLQAHREEPRHSFLQLHHLWQTLCLQK